MSCSRSSTSSTWNHVRDWHNRPSKPIKYHPRRSQYATKTPSRPIITYLCLSQRYRKIQIKSSNPITTKLFFTSSNPKKLFKNYPKILFTHNLKYPMYLRADNARRVARGPRLSIILVFVNKSRYCTFFKKQIAKEYEKYIGHKMKTHA